MLKSIAEVSPDLAQFVEDLNLRLSKPQQRHLKQIADGLITIDGDKNLSNLYRHIVGDPCPKSAADTFREAAWTSNDLRIPLRKHLVKTAFYLAEAQDAAKCVFLSLDDSFTEKDRHSQRLENVDWHFDHTRSRPKEPVHSKGTVYTLLRLNIGKISLTVDMQQYLRKETVKKLNRKRKRGQKLRFRTKFVIACQMLKAVAKFIPRGYQVYVLFDSWYASADFIKWCRKRKWHVICRLKSNRNLDNVSVKLHNERLKHKRYSKVRLDAADNKKGSTYLLRSLTGRLNNIDQPVRLLISKRRIGDKHPRYYGSSDTGLSLANTLTFFQNRWTCEVANWYIAERLRWADCRLWRFESSDKFFMVLWLALAYLELRHAQTQDFENLAAVIQQHRNDHAWHLLKKVCQIAMQSTDLSEVLEQFIIAA